MAYQKLQGRSAAAVTPSDTLNIPSASTQDGSGKQFVSNTPKGRVTKSFTKR